MSLINDSFQYFNFNFYGELGMYKNITVVGSGVIGAAWVTFFLSRGLNVTVTDIYEESYKKLKKTVSHQWEFLKGNGLSDNVNLDKLVFSCDLEKASRDADFIQECGPESLKIKHELFRKLDTYTPPSVPLVSSSSGILASNIQTACNNPERVLVGHPFNPTYLIPLVEVVGGKLTSKTIINNVMSFYSSIGKKPIHVKKEMKGHIANRLQAALWKEAYGLIEHEVASVEDIDAAISNGPGLRWALLGPFVNQQLSGGGGGMKHLLDHLGPPMDEWWQDLYPTRLTEKVIDVVTRGVDEKTHEWDMGQLAKTRDELLIEILNMKNKHHNFN
ncbi:L-carnitine dehydrogenase [Marinomonas spartinae]|uniref:L-carnitine dehydrogenase n=1 Tax=Marinomonas spartinae TaxID=1792290 RepID=A0A1A8TSV2_9GAMM|nr:3-hydroxyacyl-CoA dehydrogenase NAD-binding domain-containing protein [Marinomonas spartinae]SBS31620.1 L-carnitine dehydrogenase [Marinomonas spartinae]SBS36394.1 L-carnitine dehydrogenase [Marinomonas spartinae]